MERGDSKRDFIRAWKALRQKYGYCTAIMKILNWIEQEEQDKLVHEAIESLKCCAEADTEMFY